MKLLIGLMAILCPVSSFCQLSSANYPHLNIGDTLPDIEINNIINYKSNKVRLSDLRGKLVILDFFATWCGSCIKELPRMDSLQKQFGNDIEIMVVGYERKSRIEDFLKTNRVAGKVRLPFVTGDSVLKKMFPYRMLPQEVWIDKTGIVKAITKSQYVNAGNIQALLAGKKVQLRLKKDVIEFDRNKPLLENNNGGNDDKLLYSNTLTKHLEGVGTMGGSTLSADSNYRRIYFINQPLVHMYLGAYGSTYVNKLLLEVKDKTKYIQGNSPWDTWSIDNTYCYELTVPATTTKEDVDRQKVYDLDKYFNISSGLKKRTVKCLTLITANRELIPKTKGGKPQTVLKSDDQPMTLLQNQPLSKLVNIINRKVTGQPYTTIVIDETNYKDNTDIQLKSDLNNIPALNKELQHYGLKLEEVEREMEMLVVREK